MTKQYVVSGSPTSPFFLVAKTEGWEWTQELNEATVFDSFGEFSNLMLRSAAWYSARNGGRIGAKWVMRGVEPQAGIRLTGKTY